MADAPASQIDMDELQRLREENEALRSQLEAQRRPTGRGRTLPAIVLVVVGSLLLPVAVATTWIRTQVFSTDDYVEMVAPLAEDPAIQEAVADAIANYVRDEFDLESEVATLLPADAEALAPIIASGAVEVVRTVALEFVKTEVFADLWAEANEIGHAVAIEVLTGRDEGAVQIDSGQIYIPIGEMITEVADRADDALGLDLVSQLPDDLADARYVVAESQGLADAQAALEVIDRIAWFSVIVSLGCLFAAFFLAPSRSRGALWIGVGIVIAMVIMRLVYAWGRNFYRDGVSEAGADLDSATAFFDIITRFLRQGVRVVFVVGAVLLLVGWVTGPGPRAAQVRDWLNRVTGRAAEHVDEPGAVSRWIVARRSVLRTVIIALAVVVLFAWERPTPLVVLLIVVFAGLLLWLIALFARAVDAATISDGSHPDAGAPAAEPEPEGTDGVPETSVSDV